MFFSGLLRVQSLREKVEEFMSTYGKLTGDLFSSTVSLDLLWHLNMATFINTSTRNWQLTCGLPPVFFLLLATPVLFASGLLSSISVVYVALFLISMCQDHLVNWTVILSLISYFCKPVSSLSIKLLATQAYVPLTKDPFVTFQSTENATFFSILTLKIFTCEYFQCIFLSLSLSLSLSLCDSLQSKQKYIIYIWITKV